MTSWDSLLLSKIGIDPHANQDNREYEIEIQINLGCIFSIKLFFKDESLPIWQFSPVKPILQAHV